MCGVVIPICGVDAVVLSPIGTAFQIACDVTPNKGLSPIGTAYYSGSHSGYGIKNVVPKELRPGVERNIRAN
jgi:hypothetical protein